jgi:hypothetical protein
MPPCRCKESQCWKAQSTALISKLSRLWRREEKVPKLPVLIIKDLQMGTWKLLNRPAAIRHRPFQPGAAVNPMSRRLSARNLKAELSSAPCTHLSEQPKRLADEHRVRFENSRSAVGATSL